MWVCWRCGAQNQDSLAACFNCGAGWQGEAGFPYSAGTGQYAPYPSYQVSPPICPATLQPVVAMAPVLAGFWIRYAAYLIDNAILQLVMIPLFLPLYLFFLVSGNPASSREFNPGFLWLYIPLVFLSLALTWGYNIFMLGRYQATLGKKVLGLVVVRTDAQPLDYKTIVMRETIGKLLSALVCNLGYIWAGFDDRKQAWHDKLAKTYVHRIK